MPLPVALSEIVGELEIAGNTFRGYINRKTGEVALISSEQELSAESEEPDDDWHEDTCRVLNSEDFIPLPSHFEIHEWSIMERFAQSLENENHCDALLEAIHGRGAFGRFKRMTERLGVRERWYEFHQNALADIVIEFLEENGIPYTRD